MFTANRHLVAVTVLSAFAFAFAPQALAQPDVNPPPPLTGHGPLLSEHRKMALIKCTDGIKFASDRYVACMTKEGEAP
jgi:hypothetical protein